jgi:hypothetical protein
MKTRILITLITLVAALASATLAPAGVVQAQEPVTPQHSAPNWQAAYWNNTSLSGTPVLQRSETSLNYDWGAGSPHPDVAADGFSARWTRYVDLSAGTYRFTSVSDDGIRVYVDNDLIIDEWYDHPAKTVSVEKHLAAGHHWIVVEYYENGGFATAKLSWGPASAPIQNWRGEYFDNPTLSGSPALVRDDANINFDWGAGSPAPGTIGADRFSVRWTQTVDLPAGNYRFSATADDGVRLWVNGHLLIEAWRDQPARTYTGDIYLAGGPVSIKMEYYENTGFAVARLSWRLAGEPGPPPSGTVLVDDADPGFVTGGSASGWHVAYEGHDGRLLWTRNNDWARANYNWARWYPDLAAGRYEVLVFVPERYTTTANARYWVSHADGLTLRVVNQSTNGNRWVSLGTYRFAGDDGDYVSLADATYETRLSRLIAFDAVKWVPQ